MPQNIAKTTTTAQLGHTADIDRISLIKEESNIMLSYALKNGVVLPNNFPVPPETEDFKSFIDYYNALVSAVSPATPESIKYVNQTIYDNGEKRKWYKIPIITKSIIIASIALIVLVTISLSPEVNMENQANGLLSASGHTLLLNLAFICSASLLGIMFYLLKTINSKIKNYTLLPVNSVEINSQILIGVISGFIISELFTFATSGFTGDFEINKMTLALLGGFSSDAIFSVLQSLVAKVNTFIGSDNN